MLYKSSCRAFVFATFVALTIIPSKKAWSYDINLGPLGHACDTCGGGVIGGLPVVGHALNEAQAQASGAALQQWIIASHNSAINGSMPIPPVIRNRLTGYASEDSMNRVRFKIGDNGFANLAHMIEQGGSAQAVTLIDVVVFRGPTEANDVSLWAHELTHVDQYSAWGVHDFAIRYARDYGAVEREAYAKGDGYNAWAQQHFSQAGFQSGQQGFPSGQQGFGNFCVTPVGRFGPGPTQPFGAQCFINTMQGPVYGQVGQ